MYLLKLEVYNRESPLKLHILSKRVSQSKLLISIKCIHISLFLPPLSLSLSLFFFLSHHISNGKLIRGQRQYILTLFPSLSESVVCFVLCHQICLSINISGVSDYTHLRDLELMENKSFFNFYFQTIFNFRWFQIPFIRSPCL